MKNRFRHTEIKWLSIHNINAINSYIREGWTLTKIHYIDSDGHFAGHGYWTENLRVKFIKEITTNPNKLTKP